MMRGRLIQIIKPLQGRGDAKTQTALPCPHQPFWQVWVAGMFVAVERGGCSFSMKTLAAQRAGALGVIIVNTAEGTLRVMADKGDGEKARIPTIL